MSSAQLDAIVVGGGVNGLVAATALARAGRRVRLLEARDELGGLAAPAEFLSGYVSPGLLHETEALGPEVVDALELTRYGLEFEEHTAPVLALGDETSLRIAGGRVEGGADGDSAALERYRARVARFAPFLRGLLEEPAPEPDPKGAGELFQLLRTGANLRRLGESDMIELLRALPMCAGDFLREFGASEPLAAALALPGLAHSWFGPWSPASAGLVLLHAARQRRAVRRGPAGLVDALVAAARGAGVELVSGCEVEGFLFDGQRVVGVRTAGGDEVHAGQVLSTCDLHTTFARLLPRVARGPVWMERLRAFRTRGTTARLCVALKSEPRFGATPEGGGTQLPARVLVVSDLNELERAFDPVKYGELPQRPALDVRIPTAGDPSLAPEGHHVLDVLIAFVPHALKAGWNVESRAALTDIVLGRLREHLPGLDDQLVQAELHTPADLEQRWRLPGGHAHHGEHALDQLLTLRPHPSFARHATPVEGLFVGGSGCHPGGGLSGMAGLLAARRCLES